MRRITHSLPSRKHSCFSTRNHFSTTSIVKEKDGRDITEKTEANKPPTPSKEEIASFAEIFAQAAESSKGDKKTQATIKAMAEELKKGINMDEFQNWVSENMDTDKKSNQNNITLKDKVDKSEPTAAALHSAKPPTGDGKIRRVYNEVKIYELPDGNFKIGLKDGHQMTTNTGAPLSVPNRILADLIASEWESHGAYIRQSCTPMTELCIAAIDQLTVNQDIDIVLSNVEYDPVFLKSQHPETLRQKQEQHWDPLIEWFNNRFGTRFHSTPVSDDVMYLVETTQPPESHQTLETVLRNMDPAHFVAFKRAYDVLQSFIVTFAFFEGRLSVNDAMYTAAIDQEFQAERWGKIPGFYDVSRADWRANLTAINLFRRLYPDRSSY